MADGIIPFDQVEDDTASAPMSSSGIIPFDMVEDDTASAAPSDARGIANDALTGVGGLLEMFDQVNPIDTRSMEEQGGGFISAIPLKIPKLFGLSNLIGLTDNQEAPVSQLLDMELRDAGIKNDQRPATEVGKLAGNMVENAVGSAPFGPIAMLASAVLGGGGGYLGEKGAETIGFNPQIGRYAGSFLGGVTPGAVKKLGVVKELGESVGPTISQMFPRIFGDAPLEAAVGRALTENATDIGRVTDKLADINAVAGPVNKLDALKTVDEITGDVGLARVTDAVENALPNAGFKQIGEARAAARAADVLGLEKGAATTTDNLIDFSKKAEETLSRSVDDFEKFIETPAWGAIDKGALVDTRLAGLDDALAAKILDVTQDGALPLEGEAAALLKRFKAAQAATDEGVVNMDVIQKLRSGALQLQRATKAGLNASDRAANKVASAIETHLRDIVDGNAEIGVLSAADADAWKIARGTTALKFDKLSSKSSGTKALEKLGLRGDELDNATLLKEGLGNSEKLLAHLDAANVFGGNAAEGVVRSQYRLALLDRLKGARQSTWADTIKDNRQTWEAVFTPDELAKIARNTDDLEAMRAVEKARTTTGSGTNTRGSIQDRINSQKGIARFGDLSTAATATGAVAGATQGYSSADTTSGGILRGLLGGVIGATVGKSYRNATARTSEAFDSLLAASLKDPRTAARVIEAAKPSELRQLLGAAVAGSAQAVAPRVAASTVGELTKRVLAPQVAPTDIASGPSAQQWLDSQEPPMADKVNPIVSKLEGGQRLDAYPPPAKGSGVTVATGIDLGQRSVAELKELGASEALIEKVTPYLGKKDSDAKALLKSKPLTLDQAEADELDSIIGSEIRSVVGTKYESATGTKLGDLPAEARDVVESLAYNFGPNLDSKLPTIWKLITDNDWAGLKRALETTSWKQPELKDRRMAEAAMLDPLIKASV